MNIAGFSGVQNYRYVGDIKGFKNVERVVKSAIPEWHIVKRNGEHQ